MNFPSHIAARQNHAGCGQNFSTETPETNAKNMKTSFLLTAVRHGLLLLLLAGVLHALPGRAQTPQFMTYQGYLTDQNGNALATNGPQAYDIVFRIWPAATGGATPLYGELQTVTVANGYFSVLLGQGNSYVNGGVTDPRPPLSTVFTNASGATNRYVEMTVKGLNSGADVVILPRLQLVSAPYAFMAANANALVSTATGSTLISSSGTNIIFNGPFAANSVTNTGNFTDFGGGIYMDNGQEMYAKNSAGVYEPFLWPRWTDNVMYLNFGSGGLNLRNDSSTSVLWIGNNGYLGIGTTAPQRLFTVNGPGATPGSDSTYQAGIGSGNAQLLLGYDTTDNAGIIAASTYQTAWRNLALAPGGGYVGIGTATPASSLQVVGGVLARGGTPGANGVNNNGYAFLGNGGDDDSGMFSTADGTLQFFINNGEAMRLNSSGVGIGTTSPAYSLDVNGSFHATSANITGGATLSGGYVTLDNSQDSSAGNVGIGGGGYDNVKLTIYANQNFGLYVADTASGADAAYFVGNVGITGTLSKGGGSFKIDHPLDPENKFLYHSFVESPDMMNVYNGNIVTDGNGDATVTLPSYFQALNTDFRYQLTAIGQFAQAMVSSEISSNSAGITFGIKTDKPNVKVSWQVTGIRQDAFAKAHRIVPEVAKVGDEVGKYLYPAESGQPEAKRISYGKDANPK